MKRISFVKSLLAVSIASTLPALAISKGLIVNERNIVSVYTVNDLPAPVDGVINLAPNTTYDFKNTISAAIKVGK